MHYQNDAGHWQELRPGEAWAPEEWRDTYKAVWDKDRFASPEVRAATDAAGWILGEHLATARSARIDEIIDGADPRLNSTPTWEPADSDLYITPATRTADGGSPAYRALLDEVWQLHIAKNAGYAGHSADPWANFRQCEAFGITAADGVLTRMSDKWSRLQSLWQNPERDQVGESVVDTLKDLSAYALILVCLLQEWAEP